LKVENKKKMRPANGASFFIWEVREVREFKEIKEIKDL
jgi:hypothetical protein